MSLPDRLAMMLGLAVAMFVPTLGLASQGPGVSEGTADRFTQATAAAMVLFPIVAIMVFALARLVTGRH